jgi:type II secretory pathway component GspD/PulD (secretin)
MVAQRRRGLVFVCCLLLLDGAIVCHVSGTNAAQAPSSAADQVTEPASEQQAPPSGAAQPDAPSASGAVATEGQPIAGQQPAAQASPPVETGAKEEPSQAKYDRLLSAGLADELGLSDQQRKQIQEIFAQRDAALRQAPAADRAAVIGDADKQVEALLTAPQREHWASIRRDETVRLRFSFRFQPWADVLNWFAEQADLSLVLDAPPPGTFNYTDTREYTIPEAIDLLNGVLLTKGYTLLRRQRMLMAIDLAGGLPADLVPTVSLAEVNRRGKFELVNVVFPIGDRPADEVKNEIQPLIGAHGQIAVLSKTKQVMVTDTAGKMRAIQAVIESIPLPAGPAQHPAEPARPGLAVFKLAGLDAKACIEILGALFPDVKVVHDPTTNQLMAHATTDKQAAIESVLTQLRSGGSDNKPRLERHPIKQANRDDLLATLKLIVPEAILRPDAQTNDLIAWATPAQQTTIRESIDKLGQRGTAAAERQIEVYTLKKADPNAALALLQKMLPEARLAIDSSTRSIVALAGLDDQRAIRATIDQLDAQRGEAATLKTYHLTADERRRLQALLDALTAELPGMRLVPDSQSSDLMVWATPAQQERVQALVDQVAEDSAEGEALEMATYRIASADPAAVLSVLQTLLPNVKFVTDPKTKQIVAWARPRDQQRIRKTIEQMDADLPEEQRLQLMSHPLGKASPDAILTMLRSIVPDVQVVSDAKNSAIVAWARKKDQQTIARVIGQAQPTTPEADRATLVVYPVPDADPIQLASMLATVFPNARFSGDRTSAKLVAWATPDEQKSIKTTVEGMLKTIPPDRQLIAAVYRPKSADVSALMADLRQVVPEARLAADPKHGALVAWATAADHEKIRATMEGLEAGTAADTGRSVAVYHARDVDASALLLLLQSIVPEGKFIPDPRAGTVMAWASAEQHQTLRKAIEGLTAGDASANRRVAKVYRFQRSDANAAYGVLRYLVPNAYFAVDTRTGSLAVTALPAEHEQVAAMVEQMEGGGAAAQDLELQVYPIRSNEPTNVLTLLRELFAQRPEVRFSVDVKSGKLLAWAQPSQQKLIRDVLNRVDADGPEVDDRQIEVYTLRDADPESVARTLNTMFAADRTVKIISDQQGGLITVWARPAVQASVKAVIEQMQGGNQEVAVLPLEVVDPFTAQSSIERLFGDRRNRDRQGVPRVDIDPEGRQILVRASREQLAEIRAMLAKMGEPQLAATTRAAADRHLRVLPFSERSVRAALVEIRRIWPQLRDNPIEIVTPSAVAATVAKDRARRAADAVLPADQPVQSQPAEPGDDRADDSEQPDDHRDQEGGGCQQAAGNDPQEKPPAGETKASERAAAAAAEAKPGDASAAEKKRRPAIVIAPGDGSITISSDDPEALDQFEQLLKSFVGRSTSGGRDFAIYHLKQANAVNVAEILQNVLSGGAFGLRGFGGATVVADQRLNAVIVQAGRNDMATIENLIHTLDSEENSEAAGGPRPKLIAVRNTSAERIAGVLRDVYKTQLTAGGARRQLPQMSQRMPSEMQALMQQLSAASSGPEMTLGVDYATNSIVVSAPAPLLREVESLVHTLDEQSNAAKPTVRVLALKRINSKALGKALDNLIQETARGRRVP